MMMIKVDDDNFNLAWEALKTRHENERILVYKPPTCQKKKKTKSDYLSNYNQLFPIVCRQKIFPQTAGTIHW